jgi:hypothetical protein
MDSEAMAMPADKSRRIDEEDIRLTTGFADIFTAVILVVGFLLLGGMTAQSGIGPLIAAGAAWALTTPLVVRRQFAACAIALATIVFLAVFAALAPGIGGYAALPAAAAMAGYWFVFRVPIAAALGFVGVVLGVLGINLQFYNLGLFGGGWSGYGPAILAGLLLFAIAMAWDASDPLRRTRRSDVAFWLHLASAPLLVHGLFLSLGVSAFNLGQVTSWPVFSMFAALALIGVIIDRRPMLVSGFAYLIGATALLLNRDNVFPNILVASAISGAAILLLAAGWSPLRRFLLGLLPDGLTQYLPPPAMARPTDPAAPFSDSDTTARAFASEAPRPAAEHEPVRLILGFNDYFVALGAGALFVGAFAVGGVMAYRLIGEATPLRPEAYGGPAIWLIIAVPAVAIWGTAEYFVRIRRMALPALVLATQFALVSVLAALLFAFRSVSTGLMGWMIGSPAVSDGAHVGVALSIGLCIAAAIANILFWWRHRVPVSLAWAAAMLVPLLFADYLTSPDLLGGQGNFPWWRLAVGGAVAFVAALAMDRSDPARTTQRADIAFWLHLLAALLWVPAVAVMARDALPSVPTGAILFAAVIGLALVTDRRFPLLVAFPFAVASGPWNDGPIFALLLVGLLLALVLRWEDIRRRIGIAAA